MFVILSLKEEENFFWLRLQLLLPKDKKFSVSPSFVYCNSFLYSLSPYILPSLSLQVGVGCRNYFFNLNFMEIFCNYDHHLAIQSTFLMMFPSSTLFPPSSSLPLFLHFSSTIHQLSSSPLVLFSTPSLVFFLLCIPSFWTPLSLSLSLILNSIIFLSSISDSRD